MKPWPKRDEWPTSVIVHPSLGTVTLIDEVGFAQAETEAAMERLRVAVDHINHEPRCAMMQPFGKMACDCGYHEVLREIGPLPS